jgi:hypothetical protein
MFVAMYQPVDLNDGTSKSISNTTTFCYGNEQFLFQQSPLQKKKQMILPNLTSWKEVLLVKVSRESLPHEPITRAMQVK